MWNKPSLPSVVNATMLRQIWNSGRRLSSMSGLHETTSEIGGRKRELFLSIAESYSPFIKETMGLKTVKLVPGFLHMEMELKPHMVGNPMNGALHGGVAATVLDHVGGFAAWSLLTSPDQLISTVDLRIDYIAPVIFEPGTKLQVIGKVITQPKRGGVKKLGGRLIRSDVELQNNAGDVLVLARACYNVYDMKKPKASA